MFERFQKKVAERFQPKPNGTVVDLDAIISETHYVRFQGKTHEILPVDVGSFLVLANGWAEVERLKAADKVTLDEIIDAYWGVINPVCPTISKAMVRSATHAQVSAVIAFVQECVNGRVTDEKKKQMKLIPTPVELNRSRLAHS